MPSPRSNQLDQRLTDLFDFLSSDSVEEWQCERAKRLELCHRQSGLAARGRLIDGLQVNWRKISPQSDPARLHLLDDPIAMRLVETTTQSNYVDEPTDFATWQQHSWDYKVC